MLECAQPKFPPMLDEAERKQGGKERRIQKEKLREEKEELSVTPLAIGAMIAEIVLPWAHALMSGSAKVPR